jgi:aldehyde dehydrogenase (NAD+)
MNNGQICAAGSRIYVQDDIYDSFVQQFTERARDFVAGDPLLEATTKGPIISAAQQDRIMGYVAKAQTEDCKLLYGGQDAMQLPVNGNFVPNAGFGDVKSDSTIMAEEIFGPVASIARFKTEDEVVALANNTEYGLAAAVFTNNINRAIRVSNALESGQVTINMWGAVNANTAFGGVKSSGTGRDLGKEAIDEWTQVKCVKINVLP